MVIETRQAYIGLWSHTYTYETQNCFQVKFLQRQGSTRLQSNSSLFGDKERTRTLHQHRAPKDEFCIKFGKTGWGIPETIARA